MCAPRPAVGPVNRGHRWDRAACGRFRAGAACKVARLPMAARLTAAVLATVLLAAFIILPQDPGGVADYPVPNPGHGITITNTSWHFEIRFIAP